MINEQRIKKQVQKAISIKPTHITLMRKEFISNGMHGGENKDVEVAKLNIFLDDSKHSIIANIQEAGSVQRIRSLTMLTVTENFEIKQDDYFKLNEVKYKVTYPGMIIKDVYNSDLELIN